MKQYIAAAAVLLMLGALSGQAQNLNPTVEVTNLYEREATGIEKPSQLMEMPDSVLKFNLDFDYTVQTTPYKGSYEFKPYLVQLHPQPIPSREGRLWIRGGAGYTFHPELSAVWTPVQKGSFRLNLYGDHRSYMGHYRNITLKDSYLGWYDNTCRAGISARSAVGANLFTAWDSGQFSADAQYRNITGTTVTVGERSNHIAQLKARVRSIPDATLAYEVGTRVSFLGTQGDFREWHSVTDAAIGTRFLGVNHLRLGVGMETVSNNYGFMGNLAVLPHYLLTLGGFNLDLGVKLSYMFRSDGGFYPSKSDFVFPDAYMSFEVVPEALVLQAAATGGDHPMVYSDHIESNPFFLPYLNHMDNSVERFNLMAGARGTVWARLHYNLKAGYALWKNGFLYGCTDVTQTLADGRYGYAPAYGRLPYYHQFYTDLKLGWASEVIDVDGHLLFRKTTIEDDWLLAPPILSGDLKALYSWGGRIKAGVLLEGQTERYARRAIVPGFVDLGLYAELQMTQSLGFWLRAGNLLNQTIQRIPFYAEKGIWFSVGAQLSL